MANPLNPKTHYLKGRTDDGQAVARCGQRVHSHLIVSNGATCTNCHRQRMKKQWNNFG